MTELMGELIQKVNRMIASLIFGKYVFSCNDTTLRPLLQYCTRNNIRDELTLQFSLHRIRTNTSIVGLYRWRILRAMFHCMKPNREALKLSKPKHQKLRKSNLR